MALTAAHLNAGVILAGTLEREVYNLPLPPPPHPLPPFSLSLIILMVFVDVKHHVYLLKFNKVPAPFANSSKSTDTSTNKPDTLSDFEV